MYQDNFKNIILIKITRSIIMFLTIYFITKYFTIGKMPYNEIIMIGSTAVITQILLDIYRPIVVIEYDKINC
jgi:hypothetical protein